MCLIALAYKVHPEFPLILAANRDEFLERPTRKLHFWDDAPHILAGRDERAGGTWMGLTRKGHFAAITNYRDMHRKEPTLLSRGALVRHVLEHGSLDEDTSVYAGFNLIYGRVDALRYHNNINGEDLALEPGIHGLSNHLLNTPWPKVQRAKQGMEEALRSEKPSVEALFRMLGDCTEADPSDLPNTGLDPEWERSLSSIMICAEGYGTRSSTVVLVSASGAATVMERSFLPEHLESIDLKFEL